MKTKHEIELLDEHGYKADNGFLWIESSPEYPVGTISIAIKQKPGEDLTYLIDKVELKQALANCV